MADFETYYQSEEPGTKVFHKKGVTCKSSIFEKMREEIPSEMENQTIVYMLVLTGLSDLPSLQLPLFVLFLLIYLLTLAVNLLILLLIFTDSHLHTPMYFFLGTLACLDMSYSSTTAPRMLFDLLIGIRIISVQMCITQFYFFLFFAVSEMSVLAVMSYDRYIAICRPLHYMQIMSWNVCVQFVSIMLVFGAIHALVHTLLLAKLTFCSSNALQSFFCDLPQLLQVSCSDTFINVLIIFLSGILFGGIIIGVTFYPYITIIKTVLKMPSKQMRSKAFSTCFSHLTVVFLFYSTSLFNYFRPNASQHTEDKVVSVFYAVLTPFLNPLIYSLRNQELKRSLRKTLQRM
ncbi:olfactory receptor 1G1 [Xenopus tropicalis]|uniref:Olfactory receptor n=1 Tax=Xenopus tropicalis TaxID=8364 RepID=A0A8J1IVN3_XENTR|nr:olfactory receptor 1G1 [Xenopus tropicalis]